MLTLTGDVQQNKNDIKEIRGEIKELQQEIRHQQQEFNQLRLEFGNLTRIVERLAFEIQSDRQNAAAERRIQQLEIDNRFLRYERRRYERRLPPSDRQTTENEE